MDGPRRGDWPGRGEWRQNGGYSDIRKLIRDQLREVDKYVRGPVTDQVRNHVQNSFGKWNHPAAKLARRKGRAAAVAWFFLLITIMLGVIAAIVLTGAHGTADLIYGTFIGVVALGSAIVSGRSALRVRALNKVELPAAPPPMPGPRSAAREPMERLSAAERALAELLRQLGSPRSNVPPDTVQHARDTGAEAAAALREVADQLQSLERARDLTPARDRGPLDQAVLGLRDQLDEGLDGYGSLIAAAGQLVAANTTGGPDKQALTDASDRLHGMAMALRDLFPDRR